jgi:GDP-4-dehydro-6-deoxy-D-mannose reductase
MKVLLTGYNGFVGNYVQVCKACEILADQEGQIPIADKYRMLCLLKKTKPDAVIHLAAQSNVPQSFLNPRETYDTNFYGTLNLLEALSESGFDGKFLFIGSGDVYGITERLPITEDMFLHPRNPYAVSKVAAEALCYEWSQNKAFDVIMARPFNHIGPGQNENFAIPAFARQILAIKYAKVEPLLKVGNLAVTRDFTDVRDIVRAYFMLLNKGENGEIYNVCSGQERLLGDILNRMLELANVNVTICQDEICVRKMEQKRSYGDCKKLYKKTKWKPEIDFDKTLVDVLKAAEEKILNEK